MSRFDTFVRGATAMVAALVLSTLSIAAAIGPAAVHQSGQPVYAQAATDRAHG